MSVRFGIGRGVYGKRAPPAGVPEAREIEFSDLGERRKKEILRMKKTMWNALGALGTAVALVAWAPSAFSASKKTPTPAAEAAGAATSSSDKSTKVEKVNLNTADEKDIAAAKGVGDKLAKALVAGRPYRTWDDVSKVKGVGSGKKLDALKNVLKLTEGVPAKDTAAADKKDTKTKSSSKGEETKAAPAAAGAAAGSAGAGSTAGSGSASASSSPSSPSKKSPSSSSSSKLAPGTKVNINTASAEELDKLPEIGPVKAKAIVDYRAANGKFAAPEDIMKVSGIKEGTFAKIKDYIVVR
jgi:comEA protein